MWGLDAHGLRVLSSQEEEAFRECGAFTESSPSFTALDLFLLVFPFQDKQKKNPETGKMEPQKHSKTSLRNLAKQGALKWGPFPVPVDELEIEDWTNQDFVVLSIGKKKREMVFFKENNGTL